MSGPRNGKFASGSPVMSAADCEKLFRELQPKLTSCWQSLATQLGLDSDRINTIRIQYRDDPEQQVFAMLCGVRKRKPKRWLRVLVGGLKHHTVGRQDVVDIIEQFFRELQASLKKASGNSRRMLEKQDATMPLQEKGTNKTPALQQRSKVKSVKRRTQNESNETVGEHQAHSSKKRKLAANPSSKGSSGTNKTPALQQRSKVKSVKRRTQNELNETVREHQAHSSKERKLAANPSSKGLTALPAGATFRPPGVHLVIAKISPNDNMRMWHLKVWRHHLLKETPQKTRNGKYSFNGKLRDESGLVIYFIYFGTFLKRSFEHLKMMADSKDHRPLYMWNVKVLEQDKEYGGLGRGESEFKLQIDEHSNICWAQKSMEKITQQVKPPTVKKTGALSLP